MRNIAGIGVVSRPLGPAMKQDFPEVEDFTRVKYVDHFLFTANGEELYQAGGAVCRSGLFVDVPVFSAEWKGGKGAQLANVYSITITESLAQKLFGSRDVVGKTIRIDSADNFTVLGSLKDPPSNSRFQFEYLLPYAYMKKLGWTNENWVSNNIFTYLLLRPNTDVNAFDGKIGNLSRKYARS